MEYNGRVENGIERLMCTLTAKLCNWQCSIYVEVPYYVSRALISV